MQKIIGLNGWKVLQNVSLLPLSIPWRLPPLTIRNTEKYGNQILKCFETANIMLHKNCPLPNWLKVAVKVETNCESIVIWTGNFSRTKSVSLSFSTESEVFVWKLWMDKKNIENITNDLLVAASSHRLRGLAYFTLALTKTVQDVKRNCTFTMKSFKTTNNMPILIKERQFKQSLFPFKSKIPRI